MFYHVKELQFNAKVSRPDPVFATLLLDQFGGANGELAAALRYFGQSFAAKKPYPDKFDMLMDIATEEFSHLEIVGATIQMLLTGINGDLKDAADSSEIMQLLNGKGAKEEMIHKGIVNPEFFIASAGAPAFTNSQGCAWTANYINGDVQGDLTSDLRSDIAAETRAKMVYEYLLQFTDDPEVKNTLNFLMTREVAHYQMFQQALSTIEPNFPPGILQADPRYSNQYFNFSTGNDFRGPWNQGETGPGSELTETFQFIDDPIIYCLETNGLRDLKPEGTTRSVKNAELMGQELGAIRSDEVNSASPSKNMQWNDPASSTPVKQETKANNSKTNSQKKPDANKGKTK